MEPYLLAGLALLFVAYVWQARAHRVDLRLYREAYAELVEAQRTEMGLLNIAHREDVAQLCQRIQAPELAVVEHQQANVQDPDAFPLTDEQLSQQQELAAFVEQVERVENENLGILS